MGTLVIRNPETHRPEEPTVIALTPDQIVGILKPTAVDAIFAPPVR
jgi:hypothetical protein